MNAKEAETSRGGEPPLLELTDVSKAFGGVLALREVSFTLEAGEIHGLVGENGAGKSTLMKIIAGVHSDFEGTMKIGGREVRMRSARDAIQHSIGMVHQELSVIADLTVAENVFLGMHPLTAFGTIDWKRMNSEARKLIRSLGLDIDPTRRMGSLPVGLQQLVELSRVLFSGARMIILDEPTSALSPPEVSQLFEVLGRLRAEGRSIIFISHFLDDVMAVSDRITVFRNGHKVITETVGNLSKDLVIGHMIGRRAAELHMGESADLVSDDTRPLVLALEAAGDGRSLSDFSLSLRSGEITGVYGFMGCGQIELARALFGKLPLRTGRLLIDGKPMRLRSTAAARRAGIAYLAENRRMMLFRSEPMYKNVSIAILGRIHRMLLKPEREKSITQHHIKDLQIRPPQPTIALGSLSGGNQQKVALAKWLTYLPKVLILSEPTRGMDVGAKEDVIRIIKALRDKGVAILVLSTEPETILTLADRVVVMKRGSVAREFAGRTIVKSDLLAAA